MSGWSHGYNVSAGYTYGFYRETAPAWLDLALAMRGFVPPRIQPGQPFRYLELGSGQGFGLCLLAAANPEGEFLGIDFSPEHTAHARAVASEMGLTNITFVEGDFGALGGQWPADYGEFDYAVMHGIYSWVPKAIRESLIAILTEAVASGGAVYVSFNTMPGWASTLPFQHLLRSLEIRQALPGMKAVDAGRELFARLEGVGSGVTKALPGLKSRIEATRKQPHAYLVQEYLHENWHPMWCSQVMGEFTNAKLELAASATLAENLIPGILPQEHQKILADYGDPRLREDLTDCLINQTFRRDVHVRGPRRRHALETSWQQGFRFWRLNSAPVPDEMPIATSFGSVKLGAKNYASLLEAIGDSSLSLAELTALSTSQADRRSLNQNLLLLVHAGWLGCGRRELPADQAATQSNAAVARLAGVGGPYRHLAAPNLGSAVPATDSELLLLEGYVSARAEFEKAPDAYLKSRLDRIGRKLAKDGKPLPANEEAELIRSLAATFTGQTLPVWRKLGVVS